jgi:hypothetical protein
MIKQIDGEVLTLTESYFDSLPQVFAYNGDGTLNFVTATDGTKVFRQTYGYDSGKVVTISAWVRQP